MKAETNIITELIDQIADRFVEKMADSFVEKMVDRFVEKLKPMLSGNGKQDIMGKKQLAKYLNISESTINKLVSNKQIPYFKIQQGQSGGVRFYKRDIDKWIARHTIPEINHYTGKMIKR